MPCPPGYKCVNQFCVPQRCQGVTCPSGERCDENTGQCVDLCAGVTCTDPEDLRRWPLHRLQRPAARLHGAADLHRRPLQERPVPGRHLRDRQVLRRRHLQGPLRPRQVRDGRSLRGRPVPARPLLEHPLPHGSVLQPAHREVRDRPLPGDPVRRGHGVRAAHFTGSGGRRLTPWGREIGSGWAAQRQRILQVPHLPVAGDAHSGSGRRCSRRAELRVVAVDAAAAAPSAAGHLAGSPDDGQVTWQRCEERLRFTSGRAGSLAARWRSTVRPDAPPSGSPWPVLSFHQTCEAALARSPSYRGTRGAACGGSICVAAGRGRSDRSEGPLNDAVAGSVPSIFGHAGRVARPQQTPRTRLAYQRRAASCP